MKIGIVCEGRLAGEDAQVLEHFARRIASQATVKAFPQGTKPELFAKAGDVAKSLFDTGHDRVVIVWDILPRWEKPDGEAQDLLDVGRAAHGDDQRHVAHQRDRREVLQRVAAEEQLAGVPARLVLAANQLLQDDLALLVNPVVSKQGVDQHVGQRVQGQLLAELRGADFQRARKEVRQFVMGALFDDRRISYRSCFTWKRCCRRRSRHSRF